MRYDEERRKKYRDDRGCFGKKDRAVATWQYEGQKEKFNYMTCPTNLKSFYYSELIGIFREYQNGKTFYSSDKMQCPNKFIQFMEIIGSLVYTKEEKERKRLERLNRRGK